MALSEKQIAAMMELERRGKLTGKRADAARELIRRNMQSDPGQKIGKGDHPLETAINSFADTATMGTINYGVAGMAALGAKLGLFGEGAQQQPLGTLYNTALKLAEQRTRNLTEDNPYSSAAGTVAGAIAGGRVAGNVARAAGVTPAATFGGRAAQYFGGGAAGGMADQVLREREVNGNTLRAGLVGGGAGVVGGAAAEKILPRVTSRIEALTERLPASVRETAAAALGRQTRPTMTRAWRRLADKLRASPDDLASYVETYRQQTGRVPSVAQVFDARDQGILQGWAARHNTLGAAFDEAAQTARGADMSAGQLKKVRSDTFEASVNPIRETPVKVSEEILTSPHVNDALAGPKMKDIRIKVGNGEPLTVGDVDRIRLKLRGMQKAEPGGPFGDFADQLREDTAAQVPKYGEALDQYRKNSKFLEGFESGKGGKALSEVSDTVDTAEGQAGHVAGAATRQGQRTLSNMAPSTPIAEEGGNVFSETSRGAAHTATGGQALGLFHIARGVHSMMDGLPENYQRELAQGLLTRDPAAVNATLGKLRQAGADQESVRQLSIGLGGLLGAGAAEATGEQNPRPAVQ